MLTRYDVLNKAVKECLMELYSLAQPSISWEAFKEENRIFKEKEAEYEALEEKPPYSEFVGPKPFEFYYLPKDIMKDICDSYVNAYKIDNQQELLDTIEVLKNYCKEPIVDKYIDDWTDEEGNHHPGYKDYDHPDNLEKEIEKYFREKFAFISYEPLKEIKLYSNELQDKFFEFLDMAGKFFNWNRDLNSFNMSVYLGPSPNTNKESVIENWKKYRNQDIEIDEEQIKKEYYGEDDYC